MIYDQGQTASYHGRGVAIHGPLPLVDASTVLFLENLAKRHGPVWAAPDAAPLAPQVDLEDLRYMLRRLSCVSQVVDSALTLPLGMPRVNFPPFAVECLAKGLARLAPDDEPIPRECSLTELLADRPDQLVLLTGCFDLIHAGHVRLIEAAAAYGRQPVVAALTSRGIAEQPKNRGDRPLCSMTDRQIILRALRFGARVIFFDGPNSLDIIRSLRPDLWVKSAQDRERSIVQEEARLVESLGGRVLWLPGQDGSSSTAIAQALRTFRIQTSSPGTAKARPAQLNASTR
ncbi:MAG: adenylyltransferase/cytidyltransferase family protein [Candidatus Accumulibacter phosphatis]|jgi:cytidyltransferase-like protein|uniref:adenylyltransferase/cytidyltransferase family protein n=1 Tax=Candidatus Accumulibacter TaxID=327159 RepID=UPI0025C2A3CA|nr:adenylyltransferase/cytidyltransferase family protein [Candidatus Accumulibacter sp. ACC012]